MDSHGLITNRVAITTFASAWQLTSNSKLSYDFAFFFIACLNISLFKFEAYSGNVLTFQFMSDVADTLNSSLDNHNTS